MFLQTEMTMKAFDIVSKAFDGKTDKAGKPYIGHLTRVASNVLGNSNIRELLTTIALLHDLVEDTDWTEEDLRKEFPDEVVDAVIALTKVEGQNYETYINNLISNKLAIHVKLSDLKDNMDVTRLPELGDYELKRLKKYHTIYNKLIKLV
jgi:(p)ppGpp synthase/HD superfamily hydrolase